MQLQYLEKNLQAKFHEAQDRWQNFLKKSQKAGGTFSVVIIGQQNNGKRLDKPEIPRQRYAGNNGNAGGA